MWTMLALGSVHRARWRSGLGWGESTFGPAWGVLGGGVCDVDIPAPKVRRARFIDKLHVKSAG